MAYGPDHLEIFRLAAQCVDKILQRADPGELPVQQPTRFALAINAKTAKGLGLTIPKSLLRSADEGDPVIRADAGGRRADAS